MAIFWVVVKHDSGSDGKAVEVTSRLEMKSRVGKMCIGMGLQHRRGCRNARTSRKVHLVVTPEQL